MLIFALPVLRLAHGKLFQLNSEDGGPSCCTASWDCSPCHTASWDCSPCHTASWYSMLLMTVLLSSGIDLITNLLQVKMRKRYTVDKSLVHVWLQVTILLFFLFVVIFFLLCRLAPSLPAKIPIQIREQNIENDLQKGTLSLGWNN